MILDELKKMKSILERELKDVETDLQKAPEGCLRISHKNGRTYYYNKKKYLGIQATTEVKALAQKSYDLKVRKQMKLELEKIEYSISEFCKQRVMEVYKHLKAERKRLVSPYDLPNEEFGKVWENKQYKSLGFDKYEGVFYTDKGDRVRSKTEVIIANKLFSLKIPYRYECPVLLEGITYYPDFTVLNKRTREVFILEHLGMLDDPDYRSKALNKINKYAQAGIVVGKNLILTFEDRLNPFDTKAFDMIIRKYF